MLTLVTEDQSRPAAPVAGGPLIVRGGARRMPAAALAANVAYIAAHVDQLIEAAQARRRAVNAPHLAALVRARFERGLPAECDELQAA